MKTDYKKQTSLKINRNTVHLYTLQFHPSHLLIKSSWVLAHTLCETNYYTWHIEPLVCQHLLSSSAVHSNIFTWCLCRLQRTLRVRKGMMCPDSMQLTRWLLICCWSKLEFEWVNTKAEWCGKGNSKDTTIRRSALPLDVYCNSSKHSLTFETFQFSLFEI